MRIWENVKSHKKAYKYSLGTVVIVLLAILGILQMLSRGAAYIFNAEMEKQTLLRGTIRVETITAHINGHVYFENLEWLDPTGETIMFVPSGDFHVRVWDVFTKNIKSTTLQELTLNNAVFCVKLDENMKVDFLKQSEALEELGEQKKLEEGWEQKVKTYTPEERKRRGEVERRENRSRLEKQLRNFESSGTHLKLKLDFNKCKMELFAKGQHYLLSNVDITMDIDTNKTVDIDFSTGTFGGTMVGSGMAIDGYIDFTEKPVPLCDMSVRFNEVKPSSLGFGMNVNDRMTLNTHFDGPISDPDSAGTVHMKELHIPGFDFYDINGIIHLEEGKLLFDRVEATVFGGKLVADGEYDFDTRTYLIRGHGSELKASEGLKKSGLNCLVELDIVVEGDSNPRKTVVKGEFVSGKGTYKWIPFKRLSGVFRSEYKDLHFWNARIEFYGLTVQTPKLRVKEGHLTMDSIDMYDIEGNYKLTIHPRIRE